MIKKFVSSGARIRTMRVRQYQPGDEVSIASIYNKAFQSAIESLPEIYQLRPTKPEHVIDWLEHTPCVLWIIESKKQIIGYAQVRVEIENGKKDVPVLQFIPALKWDLDQTNLAILPKHQRMGVGTYLVEQILKEYDDTVEFASAYTFSDNLTAERLFRKLGFTMHDAYFYPPFSDKYPLINSSIYETLDLENLTPPSTLNRDMIFRRAVLHDVSIITEIHQSNVWWCKECGSLEWNLRYIEGKYGHTVFVAEIDGKVVGSIDYYKDGRIGISGVLSEFRNQGIGSTMFYSVMRTMQQAGFKSAFVDSGLTQSEAIRMYARFGFSFQRRQNAWIKELV